MGIERPLNPNATVDLAPLDASLHYTARHTRPFLPLTNAVLMSDPRLKLMEAIARKQTIAARYNGERIKLAPHVLFERHGDLFICALNMTKSWRTDAERRLGQFKVAGLAAVELLDEGFDPLPSYAAVTPRSDDTLILAI
jgi:hypothetical protein